MKSDIEREFSGTFKISDESYEINTIVNLYENNNTFSLLQSEHDDEDYYNFVMNVSESPEDIRNKIEPTGIGSDGNFLYLLRGLELRPYNSTGSHEAGHWMGLVDLHGDNSPIPSLMQPVKIRRSKGGVERELRSRPTENEFKEIFNLHSLSFKVNGTYYINY